jgi:hypothetical protein
LEHPAGVLTLKSWTDDKLQVSFFVKCNTSETQRKVAQHLNIPSRDQQLSMMKITHSAVISNKGLPGKDKNEL